MLLKIAAYKKRQTAAYTSDNNIFNREFLFLLCGKL